MKHKILISEKVEQETIDLLQANNIEIKYGTSLDEDIVMKEIVDCDAVMVRVMKISKRVIESAPKLQIIAKHGVGCDSIDLLTAQKRNIPVVYSPGANAQSVAEHTMALILACTRHIKETSIEYSKGNYFAKNTLPFFELSKKIILLIGFGNIARKVANIAHFGFEMEVLAYDVKSIVDDVPEYVSLVDNLRNACNIADIVSVHIPGTQENTNLINEDFLNNMKNTAVLINTARGNIVDLKALNIAIEHGVIGGAGLDVTNPEPIPKSSPLFLNKKIILTPHCAAAARESMIKMGITAAKGVIDFFNGIEPDFIYKM